MFTLNCKGILLPLSNPIVMGILNITNDSFYKGYLDEGLNGILAQAEKMLNEGASIIDIGGQTTKPGSNQLSEEEELQRILPVIEIIKKKYPNSILSVDTFYSKVACAAVSAGASIINDISGGEMDKKMMETVAQLEVPYICMHMQGTPQTMQKSPYYNNVVDEILEYFIQKIRLCTESGIKDIIIDPGFGFGKTITHNFTILKNLSAFEILEKPLLVGVSRKATIYKTLETTAESALNGTTVLNTIALQNGANILRVHDVKEAMEAVKLCSAMS